MQHGKNKNYHFFNAVGLIFKKLRIEKTQSSINNFAREYDIDRGHLSKIERGLVGCSLLTAWKIAEATGMKFSDFAKLLEEELGEDFKLMDE